MTAATTLIFPATAALSPANDVAAKLTGVMIAALLPAVFWTSAAAGVGALFGVTFALSSLLIVGSAIAAFLGAVCAPIMLKA
jgi:hypothetical protein